MTAISRPWALALLASVALNLFIGGMFAATLLQRGHGPGPPPPQVGLGWAREALGEEGRPAIERVQRSHQETIRPRVRELRAAGRDVVARMDAEPFDRAALSQAFAELRTRTAASQAAIQEAIVDLAAELTPAERHRLAEFAARPRPRREPPRRD